MRQLTAIEFDKIEFLTSKGVEIALIEPTPTGLDKSIMDATVTVRDLLERYEIHVFKTQKQGPEHKRKIDTKIVTDVETVNTTTSFYRPKTKQGDPRLWISKIGKYCNPHDIIALAYLDDTLWAFNITQLNLRASYDRQGLVGLAISRHQARENLVADELLSKIREISIKGFIRSPYTGDTAIGRLLETELGIDMNSRKEPDYKGIELKSARAERKNRKNLFAQVPNWHISKLKSSKEILDRYGYVRSGVHRLYCTVTATNFNPQTLRLKIDDTKGELVEYSSLDGDVVRWKTRELEDRLLNKHRETFWVEAVSKHVDGVEHFKFTKVEHTRDPLVAQLSILIEQGKISLDHLIKEKGDSAVEKGPIFKLDQKSLALLFPPSETHTL